MLRPSLPQLLRGCCIPPWQPSPGTGGGTSGLEGSRGCMCTPQTSPANSSSLGCLIPGPATFLGVGADQSPRVPALLPLWANLAISASLI